MEHFDVCGLTVTLKDISYHNKYMELKKTFEDVRKIIERDIVLKDFESKEPISHGIKTKNFVASFCVDGKELHFGMYDLKTKEIRDRVDFSEIKDIYQAQQDTMIERAENFIDFCSKDLMRNTPIDEAWEQKIEEELDYEID